MIKPSSKLSGHDEFAYSRAWAQIVMQLTMPLQTSILEAHEKELCIAFTLTPQLHGTQGAKAARRA